MSVSKCGQLLASFMVYEMKVIGFTLIVPVSLANPFHSIQSIVEDHRGCFYQVEIDGPQLADQWTFAGAERSASMLGQPAFRFAGSSMVPDKINDRCRIVQPMRMVTHTRLS